MDMKTICYCIVALLLGMLLANMLKNVCGCNVVEGYRCNPKTDYNHIKSNSERCSAATTFTDCQNVMDEKSRTICRFVDDDGYPVDNDPAL